MAYNQEYPGVDAFQYNADWLLSEMKRVTLEWVAVQKEWDDQKTAFEALKQYIKDYFDNLDVTKEISDKINSMVDSGEFLTIIEPVVPPIITKWLRDNMTPTSPPLDKTLTVSEAAADAKTVGDKAYLWRGVLPDTATLISDYKLVGSYGIPSSVGSKLTDKPDGLKANTLALMNMKGFDGNTIIQTLYTTAYIDRPYYRYITTTTISPWVQLPRIDFLYKYNGYAPEDTTKLSDLRALGTYGVTSAVTPNLTDKPPEVGNSVLTVQNLQGFGAPFITQSIWTTTTAHQPFFRTINLNSGVVGEWFRNVSEAPAYNSLLNGSNWTVIGDSFTHGDFTGSDTPVLSSGKYAGKTAVYPYLIGNRTGINVTDLTQNGLRLGGSNGFTATMLSSIPSNSEYITIALGINDTPSHQSTPLGRITDTTNTTFYGAWNVLMNHIFTICPGAHIGIIVPNGIDWSERAYADAIIQIAERWCVPYLNQNYGLQVPTMNRSGKKNDDHASLALSQRDLAFNVSTTNTHPNAAAHEYMSRYIEYWLYTI